MDDHETENYPKISFPLRKALTSVQFKSRITCNLGAAEMQWIIGNNTHLKSMRLGFAAFNLAERGCTHQPPTMGSQQPAINSTRARKILHAYYLFYYTFNANASTQELFLTKESQFRS